jgi:hypothetical protein
MISTTTLSRKGLYATLSISETKNVNASLGYLNFSKNRYELLKVAKWVKNCPI